MGVSRADNSVKLLQNLPISNPNPKPDLHNINAHTKFGENPVMFTQVIIRKQYGLTDRHTTDGRRDRHMDVQHETIIPRHYRVVGYTVLIFFLFLLHKNICCGYSLEATLYHNSHKILPFDYPLMCLKCT